MFRRHTMDPAHGPADAGSGGGGDGKTGAGAGGEGKGAGDGGKAGGEGKAGGDGGDGGKAGGEGKAGEGSGSKAGDKPKAPESYNLQLPEGGRVDDSDLKQIAELAKKAGWSNEDAQAAVNEHDALLKAQSDRFLAGLKADPDYGGDNLETSQKLARAVIDKIRPQGHAKREAFLRFLNRGGAGNHVEVVSFLADLGKLMQEDQGTGGKGAASEKAPQTNEERAAKLYPTSAA